MKSSNVDVSDSGVKRQLVCSVSRSKACTSRVVSIFWTLEDLERKAIIEALSELREKTDSTNIKLNCVL